MHRSEQQDRQHVWDSPRNVGTLIRCFFGACAFMFLLDVWFFFEHKHASFEHGELPYETWFGFYSVYGFVSCVLLVLIAKQLRKVLKRPETYYGTSATYDTSGIETGEPEFRDIPFGHERDHGHPAGGPGHHGGARDV